MPDMYYTVLLSSYLLARACPRYYSTLEGGVLA